MRLPVLRLVDQLAIHEASRGRGIRVDKLMDRSEDGLDGVLEMYLGGRIRVGSSRVTYDGTNTEIR